MKRRLFVSGTALTGLATSAGLSNAVAASLNPKIYCSPSVCPPPGGYLYTIPVASSAGSVKVQYNTFTSIVHSGTTTRGDQYTASAATSTDSSNVHIFHNITAPAIRATPIQVETTMPKTLPTTTFTDNGITVTQTSNGGIIATFESGGFSWMISCYPTDSTDEHFAFNITNSGGLNLSSTISLASPFDQSAAAIHPLTLGMRSGPNSVCSIYKGIVVVGLAAGSVISYYGALQAITGVGTASGLLTLALGAGIIAISSLIALGVYVAC